jgi:hypothetical protein
VSDPVERQEVVFAQRLERDVAGQHQLVVALVVGERGQVERAGREQLGVGARHPLGRLGQVLRRRVVAERDEQVANRPGGGVEVDGAAIMDHPQASDGRRVGGARGAHASPPGPSVVVGVATPAGATGRLGRAGRGSRKDQRGATPLADDAACGSRTADPPPSRRGEIPSRLIWAALQVVWSHEHGGFPGHPGAAAP